MFNEVWIATGIGLIGGSLLAYVAAKWLIKRMPMAEQVHPERVRFAQFGALLAALLGFFFAYVLGGIGGTLGEAAFGRIGISFGLACGIAVVFGAVLLLGVVLGLLVAATMFRGRNGRAT